VTCDNAEPSQTWCPIRARIPNRLIRGSLLSGSCIHGLRAVRRREAVALGTCAAV